MHIRTWCYAVLCLFLPITLPAQKEHKYLDHALPEAWQENDSDFQQTLPVDDQWWKNFNDPTLDSLIEVAVKQNYSVLMAADRIAMAKANLRIQQGSYSPILGLAAGWTRQQSSGHTSNLPQTITQYSDAALSMNWEIDVFGSIRNRVKAQKENFAASKEDYNAVMVSLCAQVASAYINLRKLQQEVEVVKRTACRNRRSSRSQKKVRNRACLKIRCRTSLIRLLRHKSLSPHVGSRNHPVHKRFGRTDGTLSLGRPGNHGNTEAIAGIHRDNRHRHSRKPATTPAGHPGG